MQRCGAVSLVVWARQVWYRILFLPPPPLHHLLASFKPSSSRIPHLIWEKACSAAHGARCTAGARGLWGASTVREREREVSLSACPPRTLPPARQTVHARCTDAEQVIPWAAKLEQSMRGPSAGRPGAIHPCHDNMRGAHFSVHSLITPGTVGLRVGIRMLAMLQPSMQLLPPF